jgi:hypothetical protein
MDGALTHLNCLLYSLTPWSRIPFEKLIVALLLLKKFLDFKKPIDAVPCLQDPATGHYPEPDKSSSHPHNALK